MCGEDPLGDVLMREVGGVLLAGKRSYPFVLYPPNPGLVHCLKFSVRLAFLSKAIVCVSDYNDMWAMCKRTRPPIDFLVSVSKTS